MKTLYTVIEQELKRHIDDLEICSDIVVAGTENPDLYDGIISYAADLAEDVIKTNFKYIIQVAHKDYDQEVPVEEDDHLEQVDVDTNVSEEDSEMLAFIAG